jgi:hypothetical protein
VGFLVLAAPAAIALIRQALGWKTVTFYGLALFAVSTWNLGFNVGAIPDAASLAKPKGPVQLEGSRCEQAIGVAERGGIVLTRSESRLVVKGEVWSQLPEEVRTALTECARLIRPPHRQDQPLEVVERAN